MDTRNWDKLTCADGPEAGRMLRVPAWCGEVVVTTEGAGERIKSVSHRYVRSEQNPDRLVYRGSRLRRARVSPCTCPACS